MNPLKLVAACGLAAAIVTGATYAAPSQDAKQDSRKQKAEHGKAKVGEAAPAFTLKDASGKDVSLADFKGKVVVLEWMNPGCPVCRERMENGAVAKMIADSKAINGDVVFLFINSTAATAGRPQESADYLAANKVSAPALIDGDGTVGHMYGAKTTPHCFVIAADGTLAYDGAFDDQAGKAPKNYVVAAVKALKDGAAVSPATTKPYGCGVKYGK